MTITFTIRQITPLWLSVQNLLSSPSLLAAVNVTSCPARKVVQISVGEVVCSGVRQPNEHQTTGKHSSCCHRLFCVTFLQLGHLDEIYYCPTAEQCEDNLEQSGHTVVEEPIWRHPLLQDSCRFHWSFILGTFSLASHASCFPKILTVWKSLPSGFSNISIPLVANDIIKTSLKLFQIQITTTSLKELKILDFKDSQEK